MSDSLISEEVFECPVCYTDGSNSGLVHPLCKHTICLSCYSRILLHIQDARCPYCRRNYIEINTLVLPDRIEHIYLRVNFERMDDTTVLFVRICIFIIICLFLKIIFIDTSS